MDGKRRMDIPETIAGVPNLFAGMIQLADRAELRHRAKGVFSDSGSAHALASSIDSPDPMLGGWGRRCGSASGKTLFTSDIATIGRNRMNSRNSVIKMPWEPMKVNTSTQVG